MDGKVYADSSKMVGGVNKSTSVMNAYCIYGIKKGKMIH